MPLPNSGYETQTVHACLMVLPCPICMGCPKPKRTDLDFWLASSLKQKLQLMGCWKLWGPQLSWVEIVSDWKLDNSPHLSKNSYDNLLTFRGSCAKIQLVKYQVSLLLLRNVSNINNDRKRKNIKKTNLENSDIVLNWSIWMKKKICLFSKPEPFTKIVWNMFIVEMSEQTLPFSYNLVPL